MAAYRPCIMNYNWGGVNTDEDAYNTCSQATQTLTITVGSANPTPADAPDGE